MLTIGEVEGGAPREYASEISAAEHADLAFEVPGKIVELPVQEAKREERDAVLARLDARD